jgi:tetratricopeptide (TPR) repeat protein
MSLIRLAFIFLLLCAPAWAAADPCDGDDARRLSAEGLRLYKEAFALSREPERARALYEQALRCFERAIAVSQTPAKIYHPLGLVYEKLDRREEAIAAFERFLAEVPESERSPQVTQKLRDKLAALRAGLPPPAPPRPAPPPVLSGPPLKPAPRLLELQPRRQPRWGLIITGSAMFGTGYLLSVLGGALCEPQECGPQGWTLYLPLFGSFVEMGYYRGIEDRGATLAVLFADGLIQVTGAALIIAGAIGKRRPR